MTKHDDMELRQCWMTDCKEMVLSQSKGTVWCPFHHEMGQHKTWPKFARALWLEREERRAAEPATRETLAELADEHGRITRHMFGDTPAERPPIPDPDTAFAIAKARSDELKGLKTFHPLPDLGEYIDKVERGATGTDDDEEPGHD